MKIEDGVNFMTKNIKITESMIRSIIHNNILNEHYIYKKEWNKDDQTLAMYHLIYGISSLGISLKEVANDIIGTTVASFLKQTSNFNYLLTEKGLDRPNLLQTKVFEEFIGVKKNVFKQHCLNIVNNRLKDPEDAVVRKKLGKEIGDKREALTKSREIALQQTGRDPKKFTYIGGRPKIDEQSVGGFIAPGNEDTYNVKNHELDFNNFIMYGQKLLDNGVTIGELLDKLAELPKSEPKERIPNNDYEIQPGATPIYHPPMN